MQKPEEKNKGSHSPEAGESTAAAVVNQSPTGHKLFQKKKREENRCEPSYFLLQSPHKNTAGSESGGVTGGKERTLYCISPKYRSLFKISWLLVNTNTMGNCLFGTKSLTFVQY